MKRLFMAAALSLGAVPAAAEEAAPDYGRTESWLCLPGRADACGTPLATTALNANGYGATGLVRPAENPPIDCFYVYPTVSRDAALNSDMDPGPEEQAVAAVQFARFASLCRPYAPLYRQATLASIAAALGGRDAVPILDAAYRDVLAAWRHYLAHENDGRPFVLIGHSQGTIHLARLVAEEIEGRAPARHMLSALLIGFNIEVPAGALTGGTFRETPLCTREGETGCILTYVSFRAASPPPPEARFGRALRPGMTIGCTNPAALGGGRAPLDSYWHAGPSATGAPSAIQWSREGPPPTPFLRTEGLVSAECVNDGPAGYLAVTVDDAPGGARTREIPGDVVIAGQPQPGWGLHLVDINLALGDLLRLVEAQRDAFLAAAPPEDR